MAEYEDFTPDTIRKEFDKLRGSLCGLVESWGLPEKQERGAIATLKSLSYHSQGVISDGIEEIIEDSKMPRYITGG